MWGGEREAFVNDVLCVDFLHNDMFSHFSSHAEAYNQGDVHARILSMAFMGKAVPMVS